MKRIIPLLIILFFISIRLSASPAIGVKRIVTLADGSKVELTLHGDEDYHYWRAADGRAFVVRDGSYVQVSPQEVDDSWAKNRKVRGKAVDMRTLMSNTRGAHRQSAYTGTKKGLVILVEFTDLKMSVTSDPKAYYNDFFNKKGFNENGNTGSVSDYFYDQSYGTFNLEFDVVGPIQAKYQMAYYGQNNDKGNDMHARDLMVEACKAADKYVDFKDYDWDGDGVVDNVFIVYAGYGESDGGSENTIWPHESSLKDFDLRLDGKTIDVYACSCELSAMFKIPKGVGTACHEFSHCLGLHDMYDTTYSGGWGTGNWDVMNSGDYNNKGCTPAAYTSYEKMVIGWASPQELSTQTSIKGMRSMEESQDSYILYNDANRDEYYMLENRQPVKWDKYLGGHGLLVLHIDYKKSAWESNNINSDPNHQRVTIVPADGKRSSVNLSGDPFPGTSHKTMLNKQTSPANIVYNTNTDGSLFLNKNIDSIEETEDGLISFVACRPDPSGITFTDVKTLSDNSFSVSWTPSSAGSTYELELAEFPAFVRDKDACRLFESDLKEFYASKAGFSDVSSKLTQYLSTGWLGSKLFCTPNYMRVGTTSAAGYLVSPTYDSTASGEVTYALDVKLYNSSTPVKGVWEYITPDGSVTSDFEVMENGLLVLHQSDVKTRFRLAFYPESPIYVSHIYIFDGYWTAEELQSESAQTRAARRVITTKLTTTDTSYLFEGLNSTSTYSFKVRATDGFMYTDWTEEKSIAFDADPINAPIDDADASVVKCEYFDLNGRKLSSDALQKSNGVVIEKRQMSNGKVNTRKMTFFR